MPHLRPALRAAGRLRADGQTWRAASTSTSTSTDGNASSSATPLSESWQRPIPEGTNPAYDLALQYLEQHGETLRGRASRMRERSQGKSGPELRALVESANALELKAKLNDPKVRWAFEESGGRSDSQEEATVFSLLAKEKWRNEGGQDLLMQRITTMNIIPDLTPPFSPPESMTIAYPAANDGPLTEVVPGEYLSPSQTVNPPKIVVNSFRAAAQAARFNTLIMVDADRPDPASSSFKQYVHWIVPNISVDASTSELPLSDRPSLLSYQPPHPSVSTPYHRYAFFLLEQPSERLISEFQAPEDRLTFDLRQWVQANGFGGELQNVIRAAGLFREGGKRFGDDELRGREMLDMVAREEGVVAQIYKDTLGIPVPVWKKAPKEMKYGTPAERAAASALLQKLS